jgi:acyl-CoA thioesterase-2
MATHGGFEQLLCALALEADPRVPMAFRAPAREGAQRHLFGGLVAGQATIAAGRGVPPGRRLHSLHAYFLRAGRGDRELLFEVERLRDGGSFSTRAVKVLQDERLIFTATASFCDVEEGISHQDEMPPVPPPEGLADRDEERARVVGQRSANRGVEVRMCDPHPFGGEAALEPAQHNWLRLHGELPDDPLLHEAAIVYASDTAFMSTVNRRHAMPWRERIAASLDHSIWLHRAPRFDDWILFASDSPAAHAARGLIWGALYDRGGRRLASVAQEALMRRRRGPQTAQLSTR